MCLVCCALFYCGYIKGFPWIHLNDLYIVGLHNLLFVQGKTKFQFCRCCLVRLRQWDEAYGQNIKYKNGYQIIKIENVYTCTKVSYINHDLQNEIIKLLYMHILFIHIYAPDHTELCDFTYHHMIFTYMLHQ